MRKTEVIRAIAVISIFTCFPVFCFTVFYSSANVPGWEKAFENLSGKALCVDVKEGTNDLYVGAEDGLYVTKDSGGKWEKAALPGGAISVRDIAVAGGDIYLAAGEGLYRSGPGDSWKWIPGKKGIVGVAGFRDKEDMVLAWTKEELFRINGKSWERIDPALIHGSIDDAACRGKRIYVASGTDMFISSDEGETWKKVALLKSGDPEAEIEESDGDETDIGRFSRITDVSTGSRGMVVVATKRGIFKIEDGNSEPELIDTTGLPSTSVAFAAGTEKDLFAATHNKVFRFSGKDRSWQPVFEARGPGDISSLKACRDNAKRDRLLVSCGNSVYMQNIDDTFSFGYDPELAGRMVTFTEPSIIEVQAMAIEYAEVSPEKIRSWRRGARWKALLPKLSVGFSESYDDNIDIYKSSSYSYVIRGPRERGNDWDVDLVWDLSDLIWNDAQTSIDVRSKLMVQLRDDILEEVTRLYFERKKLLAGLERPGDSDEKAFRAKKLRIEELTAYIDALTGGKFSEALGSRE